MLALNVPRSAGRTAASAQHAAERKQGIPPMATEGNAAGQPTTSTADDDTAGPAATPDGETAPVSRWSSARSYIRELLRAIRESDTVAAEQALLQLSRRRRWLAPLALAIGALMMLFVGVKLLVTNWGLLLVQVLPAMWIWLAMLDLKGHVLHGKSFHVLTGPILIPLVLAVAAITAASFYLNAVFGYAISEPGKPQIRPAFRRAWSHRTVVLGAGAIVGLALGVSTLVVTRWGPPWFALSLGLVVGVMMFCYVAIPARLIGMKTRASRRDKLTASAVGGAIGAIVCTPAYALGRLGLLMLGWNGFFVLGIIVLAIGFTAEACATSAVKAIKMSAKLVSGPKPGD
jgi:uncharacterized membrane protein